MKFKFLAKLTPKKAAKYLKKIGVRLPPAWVEFYEEAQKSGDTIADEIKLNVLQRTWDECEKAIAKGQTFAQFKKAHGKYLKEAGYANDKRLKLIYRTNQRDAYMAGRFKAQLDGKRANPYGIYVCALLSTSRDPHVKLDYRNTGKAYPIDHPIWRHLYAPNGYNCHCIVRTISAKQAERMGLVIDTKPELTYEKRKLRTGETEKYAVYSFTDKEGKEQSFEAAAGFSRNPGLKKEIKSTKYHRRLVDRFRKKKK